MSDGKPILLRFEMRLQDLRRIQKTGSQQTYQEAKQRKQDRPTLGQQLFVGTQATEQENDWANICDRSPLMERLDEAIGLVKPAIANEAVFQSEVGICFGRKRA